MESGTIQSHANHWLLQLMRDLELHRGVSGTESFVEAWGLRNDSQIELFDYESGVAHEFLAIDPGILRAS
eukprot:3505271-Pyramimonas_sp.AAC.1